MKLMKKAKRAGRFHLLTAAVFLVVLSVWSPVFADEADVLEPVDAVEVEGAVPVEGGAESEIEDVDALIGNTDALPTEVEVVETEIEAAFDKVISVADGYIVICKDDKVGLLDEDGQIIIPCEYDYDYDNLWPLNYYSYFKEKGLNFMLKIDGRYGVISLAGEQLSPFKYDDYLEQYDNTEDYEDYFALMLSPFNSSGIAVVQEKGQGWGIINSQGEEVVTPQYSSISEFVNGRAVVDRFDLYGFIDEEGREIINCQYDRASDFANGHAVVENRGRYGIVDENGRTVIQPVYDKVYNFNENGLACVVLEDKTSFVDQDGNVKFSLPSGVMVGNYSYYFYSDGLEFSDGLLPVVKKLEDADAASSYYDYYDDYYYYDYDYYYYSYGYDYKYGYIDENGNIAIPFEYDVVRPFEDGLAIVSKVGLYGIINKNGDIVVDCQYRYIWHGDEGFTAVGDDDSYHVISLDGELIVDSLVEPEGPWGEYDEFFYWLGEYYGTSGYYVSKDEKKGFISEDGEVLVPAEYDEVFVADDRFASISQDGLDGLYDMERKIEIIPREYVILMVDWLDDGTPVILAYKDQKKGVLSIDGEELIPFMYDDFKSFNETSIAVGQGEDGLYRYIDINNQVVIPGEFKFAGAFIENKALVQKLDGKWYTLELVQDIVETAEEETAEDGLEAAEEIGDEVE